MAVRKIVKKQTAPKRSIKKATKKSSPKRSSKATKQAMIQIDDEISLVNTTRKVGIFTNEPDPLTVEPTQPLIQSPVQKRSGFLDAIGTTLENEYDRADLLILEDDRIRGNLDLFAQMTSRAYQGVDITQKGDTENPIELSDQEKELIITAQELDNRLNFKRLFQSYTKSLIKYGDLMEHIETDTAFLDEEFDEDLEATDAVTGLTPLPINQMTIIDEASRIDDPEPDKVITQANIYVVDEENADTTEDDPVSYDKTEILHISLDPRTNWKEDVIGRSTFGIWSDAPLKSIIYLLEWKHNLIRNDMIWRNKMVPREHHKLNMSAFSPDNYPGSDFTSRLNSAKIAATTEMNLYSASVRAQQPDQGYVTSTDVEIVVIEPKSTNYHEINAQINQIDSKISSLTGTPEALSGGETTGFSSVEFSGTFVSMRSEEMAQLIADSLNRVIWKHLKAIHTSVEIADIKRVRIKTRLILDRDLTERAKVISILTGTNLFTPTEIRDVFGLEALTDSQQEEITNHITAIAEAGEVGGGQSQEDVTANALAETGSITGNQQSKQKRINDNIAIGDRKGERGVPKN